MTHLVESQSIPSDAVTHPLSQSLNYQDVLDHNRKVIRSALFDLGVTEVNVEYYGGGDSGDVSEVSCQPMLLWTALGSTSVEIQDACRWFNGNDIYRQVNTVSCSLQEALEAFAMFWLEIEHGGWEIDDGGSGTMWVDVMADRFTLNHREYYQESNEYEHEMA